MVAGGKNSAVSAAGCGNLIQYKGFVGRIEYDDEAGIFHGEVINLRDVITFRGESVQQLRQALQDSVEDYLEFCAERGEEPERPFSGKFIVRIDPELHRQLYVLAKKKDTSINKLVSEAVEKILV
jgi:predicted HicB family RNase H-like nuclease